MFTSVSIFSGLRRITLQKSDSDHRVIVGDSIDWLQRRAGQKFQLAVCDPPYSFGVDYDVCNDRQSREEYLDWTKRWLNNVYAHLSDSGTLWVFTPEEWVADIEIYCRDALAMIKRRHVIWAFGFGQAAQNNFTRSYVHLLYLTVDPKTFTFNPDAIRVPSARQAKYGDKRANPKGKLPDATWMLYKDEMDKVMQPDQDVWLMSRVCGTYKERVKEVPNQIPIPLLERIILSTSNPGDLVLDPFLGSGSTLVAAKRRGRRGLGIELSRSYADIAKKRIEATIPLKS